MGVTQTNKWHLGGAWTQSVPRSPCQSVLTSGPLSHWSGRACLGPLIDTVATIKGWMNRNIWVVIIASIYLSIYKTILIKLTKLLLKVYIYVFFKRVRDCLPSTELSRLCYCDSPRLDTVNCECRSWALITEKLCVSSRVILLCHSLTPSAFSQL